MRVENMVCGACMETAGKEHAPGCPKTLAEPSPDYLAAWTHATQLGKLWLANERRAREELCEALARLVAESRDPAMWEAFRDAFA